jgi:hypothetical protein
MSPSSSGWKESASVFLVITNAPNSLIISTLKMEATRSPETAVLTGPTQCHIQEHDGLHSDRREHVKSYIALTGWALYRRRNVSPVRYELSFYITEDDILHSHRRENLKSYIALTGWAL